MRDERTDNAAFRAALRELTQMLVYEATRDLALAEEPIQTPVTATTGYRLAAPPLIGGPPRGVPGWRLRPCSSPCSEPVSAWPTPRTGCCRSRRWASSGSLATKRPS